MGKRCAITGRHKGHTALIVGTAPTISPRPDVGSVVIGVNNAPLLAELDYWVVCDVHHIGDFKAAALAAKGAEWYFWSKWAGGYNTSLRQPDYWFDRPKGTKVDRNHQPVGEYPLPKKWDGALQHHWTVATAALHLAAIMGCTEAVLWGVDLTGETKCGSAWIKWAYFAPEIEALIKRLPMTVYKTNPDSPLDLPLYGGV